MGVRIRAQISEMMEAEALAVFQLFTEGFVIFIQVEKGIHVACVFLGEIIADIAGFFLFRNPGGDGVGIRGSALQLIHQGGFAGSEVGELILHFRNELLIMGLQNPAVS